MIWIAHLHLLVHIPCGQLPLSPFYCKIKYFCLFKFHDFLVVEKLSVLLKWEAMNRAPNEHLYVPFPSNSKFASIFFALSEQHVNEKTTIL